MVKKIDFIIIGAQKSGSTFLYNILNLSNEIFMPEEKELPFFLEKNIDEKNYQKFLNNYFKNSKIDQKIGTSTPQYMMYPESFKFIKSSLPTVKLIAILREPIKRLISHYDMAYRFGKEKRSINSVLEYQLENIEYYRKTPFDDPTGKYIVAGEYGRIFSDLLKNFDKSQIHVLLFKDLISQPKMEIRKIMSFLDLKSQINEFKKFKNMRGGKKKLINIDLYKIVVFFKKIGLKNLIPNFLIKKTQTLLSFVDNVNVDTKSKTSINEINPKLLEKLKDHYRKDLNLLKNIVGVDLNVE
tara:strand:- start:734 stop:1627 length:894 start_codon:yes stop_codon:yes gene_type:complete